MKNIITLSSIILFIACKTEKPKESVNLITELDSVSYSLGVNIGENIKKQFPDIDLDNFEAAIKDVLDESKEPKISNVDAQKLIQDYFTKIQAKASESVMEDGKKFLEELHTSWNELNKAVTALTKKS